MQIADYVAAAKQLHHFLSKIINRQRLILSIPLLCPPTAEKTQCLGDVLDLTMQSAVVICKCQGVEQPRVLMTCFHRLSHG